MTTDIRIPAHQPTNVGTMLKEEFLDPMTISQGELAKAMGVSRKTVNELCGNKRGITAETALLLSKVLATTPEFWINLQIMNDLWTTSHSERMKDKLDKAVRLVEPEAA